MMTVARCQYLSGSTWLGQKAPDTGQLLCMAVACIIVQGFAARPTPKSWEASTSLHVDIRLGHVTCSGQ